MSIVCQYYSREPGNKHNGLCALGWSSGVPFAGECQKCLKEGRNTPEAFQKAKERYERSHPEEFRGTLKGCCGSALNESS